MKRPVEVAVMLMRMALALLDAGGERLAAALVQQAIDSVETDTSFHGRFLGEGLLKE